METPARLRAALSAVRLPNTVPPAVRRLALVATSLVGALLLFRLFRAVFSDTTSCGIQDWDTQSAYRTAALLHLARFHEGPWWNPWLCGGFPDWGYVEGATNVISPYLPAYLALPLPLAERIELVGSTLTALAATWLLAGRVTSLVSLRTFCAVVYALNGRWFLQATVGHTWYFEYAWTPLVLYCLLRAVAEDRWGWCVCGGAVLALMVYQGGIYPLPHTVLLVAGVCLIEAVARRTRSPFAWGALMGAIGLGLAAPKLIPETLTMARFPRAIDSTESMTLPQLLAALVDPGQTISHGPFKIEPYRWHEYGTYVGWPAVFAFGLFLVFGRGSRVMGFRILALLLFVLALGAFSPYAPWVWLHRLPPFTSQHVPSRWTQAGLLIAALGVAATSEHWSNRLRARRGWLDLFLLMPMLWLASDLVANARLSLDHAFRLPAPDVAAAPVFHHGKLPSLRYTPTQKYGSLLLGIRSNTGMLECGAYPVTWQEGTGALAADSKDYVAEAYTVDTVGSTASSPAPIIEWSPNAATVQVPQPHAGNLLVYNMSAAPGWRANGRPTIESGGRLAVTLLPGEKEVTFSYFPPGLTVGLIVALLTVAGGAGAVWAGRRSR